VLYQQGLASGRISTAPPAPAFKQSQSVEVRPISAGNYLPNLGTANAPRSRAQTSHGGQRAHLTEAQLNGFEPTEEQKADDAASANFGHV
jgi:hypothetical protein